MHNTPDSNHKCGVVAVLGPPNAGKSTLVNQLVGQKVSIVSPKVQTTRMRVMGICMAGETQIVLADTPGLFQPQRRFEKAMVQSIWEAQAEADLTLVVLEARPSLLAKNRQILEQVLKRQPIITLVLNKIDLIPREQLLALTQKLTEGLSIPQVFMVSALKNDRISDLREFLAAQMPQKEWLFPEDDITTMPSRLYAAEVTREKLFELLYQEVPYSMWIESERWEDCANGSAKVYQTIFVEKLSQKKIVIGQGGQLLKKIGQRAREELSQTLGRPIHLFLHVKVAPDWEDKRDVYQFLGLRF